MLHLTARHGEKQAAEPSRREAAKSPARLRSLQPRKARIVRDQPHADNLEQGLRRRVQNAVWSYSTIFGNSSLARVLAQEPSIERIDVLGAKLPDRSPHEATTK
jgi:hypothetical protein